MNLEELKNKAIMRKYFYFRKDEWHHLYLGLFIAFLGEFMIRYNGSDTVFWDVVRFIGYAIAVDDLIQHAWQGYWLWCNRRYFIIKEVSQRKFYFTYYTTKWHVIERTMPVFLIHALLYKYWKVNEITWIAKVTSFANRLLGFKG